MLFATITTHRVLVLCMAKTDKPIGDTSPLDEPSIGFARPSGPPIWWYSALAVAIGLFLIIIALTFVRRLVSPPTEQTTNKTIPTVTPTNAPFRPSTVETPLSFENIQIDITASGSAMITPKTVIQRDDVILLMNKDEVKRNVRIQGTPYTLGPKEAFAYKVTTKDKVSVEILLPNGTNKVFAFVVR